MLYRDWEKKIKALVLENEMMSTSKICFLVHARVYSFHVGFILFIGMEGLRMSVLVLVSFVAGIATWAFLGMAPSNPAVADEHLAAATNCPACDSECAPSFFSLR